MSLVKTEPLLAMKKKDASLTTNIRQLDSQLQDMVYNNYTKFITAGETIHEMGTHVAEMEHQMISLTENVDKIHQSSSHVDSHLGTHRQQLDELTKQSNFLKKLKYLHEIPSRIRTAYTHGADEQVVKYYKQMKQALQLFPDVESFKTEAKITEKVAHDLIVRLQDRIKERSRTLDDVTQDITLLLELGIQEKELIPTFESHGRRILLHILKRCENQDWLKDAVDYQGQQQQLQYQADHQYDGMPRRTQPTSDSDDFIPVPQQLSDALKGDVLSGVATSKSADERKIEQLAQLPLPESMRLHNTFLQTLGAFSDSYLGLFTSTQSYSRFVRDLYQTYEILVRRQLLCAKTPAELMSFMSNDDVSSDKIGQHDQPTGTSTLAVIPLYFRAASPADSGPALTTRAFLPELTFFCDDMRNLSKRLPKASMLDLAANSLQTIEKAHISESFCRLRIAYIRKINTLLSILPKHKIGQITISSHPRLALQPNGQFGELTSTKFSFSEDDMSARLWLSTPQPVYSLYRQAESYSAVVAGIESLMNEFENNTNQLLTTLYPLVLSDQQLMGVDQSEYFRTFLYSTLDTFFDSFVHTFKAKTDITSALNSADQQIESFSKVRDELEERLQQYDQDESSQTAVIDAYLQTLSELIDITILRQQPAQLSARLSSLSLFMSETATLRNTEDTRDSDLVDQIDPPKLKDIRTFFAQKERFAESLQQSDQGSSQRSSPQSQPQIVDVATEQSDALLAFDSKIRKTSPNLTPAGILVYSALCSEFPALLSHVTSTIQSLYAMPSEISGAPQSVQLSLKQISLLSAQFESTVRFLLQRYVTINTIRLSFLLHEATMRALNNSETSTEKATNPSLEVTLYTYFLKTLRSELSGLFGGIKIPKDTKNHTNPADVYLEIVSGSLILWNEQLLQLQLPSSTFTQIKVDCDYISAKLSESSSYHLQKLTSELDKTLTTAARRRIMNEENYDFTQSIHSDSSAAFPSQFEIQLNKFDVR
ncbi:Vps51 [Blattamonas nauphoetae]|uniref:Vacuolar protein sorting-associated protein 51 homolog n=1 Tax=Blattamonas nauphoetae TaxID=2049346 RepID=A0ABQ9YKA3_9EUKA|nr:Vps51 [Blattamonas nauphoetae]